MLKPVPNGWSLVLAGHWNVAIFNPNWIIGRLTQAQDIQIELAVSAPSLSPRIRFDSICLYLGPQRLMITPDVAEASSLETVQRVGARILNDLPHTPLSAVGINFQFKDESPSSSLVTVFQLSDNAMLADARCKTRRTSITRALLADELLLNLSLTFDETDAITFDFNFHTDVKSADQAVKTLGTGLASRYDHALRILKEAYGYTGDGDEL